MANLPMTSVKKDKKHQTFHNSTGSKLKFGALSSGLNDNGSPEGRALVMNRKNSATSRKSKSQLSNISEQADKQSMQSNQSRINFARNTPQRASKNHQQSPKPKSFTKGLLSKFDDSNSRSLPMIGEVVMKKKKT
jgi:hypothetical protein